MPNRKVDWVYGIVVEKDFVWTFFEQQPEQLNVPGSCGIVKCCETSSSPNITCTACGCSSLRDKVLSNDILVIMERVEKRCAS